MNVGGGRSTVNSSSRAVGPRSALVVQALAGMVAASTCSRTAGETLPGA